MVQQLSLARALCGEPPVLLLVVHAVEPQQVEDPLTLVEQLRIATWATGAARCADLGPEYLR